MTTNTEHGLANRLAAALEEKGWTVQTLADRADVPYDRVYSWVRGTGKRPRQGSGLDRVAKELGVSESYLVFGESPPETHEGLRLDWPPGYEPEPEDWFALCREVAYLNPEAQRVTLSIAYEDGARVTYEHNEKLRKAMERGEDW